MPLLRSVPELTDLVYKPVSEMIKQEALRVGRICVTNFHINEDDDELEDVREINDNPNKSSQSSEDNNTSSMLTLDEHIKRRKACLAHFVSLNSV